jgi:multicomponent Na+:H+ antiporter subunit A
VLFLCLSVLVLACLLAGPATRLLGRAAGAALAVPLLVAAALIWSARPGPGADAVEQRVPWLPTLGADLALRLDGLSVVFALLVLVIGAAVLLYAARYLGSAGRHGSFFVLMTAFAAAMLLLVLADDLVVLFVAWELTTLCSFFLIARSGPDAREPAIRTLLVTAAGGLSLLAAVVVMAVGTGTTRISAVLAHSAWQDGGFATAVAVLLAVAAFTKSAQLPFQAWLPDSMVAATPVSAYLHAAAMVKAGIYVLLRFSPVLAGVPVWTVLLVTAGLATALLGAAGALRRHDLKELLAYSTVSQLGLLVAMIGVGTPAALTAAVVHTVAHALFKSALFLLVGVVDHEAGTRDVRELAALRTRMPVTVTALALAAASMAGVPLLLGFISKESMFEAFLHVPGPGWLTALVVTAAALTSVLTFAYSGRLVLGARGGRSGRLVPEASVTLWGVPALLALGGLVLGVAPFLLDDLVTAGAAAAGSADDPVHLALWHGLTPALGISAGVLALGTGLVVARRRVDRITAPLALPVSGLAVVDRTRAGIIRVGGVVAGWSGSTSPYRHLAVPVLGLVVIAGAGAWGARSLPPVVGDTSRPMDWVLVVLVAAGVVGAVRAATRLAAVVVVGVVGFAMTLWFVVLGAADVALTQLLVEILTVTVMVLVLRRLPSRFAAERERRRLPAVVLAVAAGAATTFGVWALTGRREPSAAAEYFLAEGAEVTGGANLVNTILVDFRALDTFGELTVLGVAGVVIAALLHVRHPTPVRSAELDDSSPLSDARANTVFARTATRVLGPVVVLVSVVLLLRGHQEPGGGFIAALVAGAGFALLHLSAPSDAAGRLRWPYLALIGSGIVVAAGTGAAGYLDGSFLAPLHVDVLGVKLTSALVFDVGVYLTVIGVVLAALNLLGRRRRVPHDDDPSPDVHLITPRSDLVEGTR